jgi:NADPH-dependent 2,4-dienoyl-CoA reductase/sulfur reductase-like enzyme
MLDVAIVGAGPAGLAAATLCAEMGLSAALYDEQPAPGGQIYRGISTSPLARPDILGDDYWHGASLLPPFTRSGAVYVPDAVVWSLERRTDAGFALAISVGAADAGVASLVEARAVILATGSHERPMPIPGWTLPGVLTAGAAQILLKTAGLVPQGRTVLAGCGPLLWLVAWQLLRAGAVIDALLDTTPRGRLLRALNRDPAFLVSRYFGQGRELVRDVRRRLRVIEHVSALAIDGVDQAQALRYVAGGARPTRAVDQVLLHQGVVPEIHLARAAGCTLAWNDDRACFEPAGDPWGGTSIPGLYLAGDGAGIAGALAAPARGRLAALAVAEALGHIDGPRRTRDGQPHRRMLARALRGRLFLDVLYRPAAAFRIPAGATIACRCEEVEANAIALEARAGCAGPNQMKAYLRCGMGPCQGRLCGLTVCEIIAREQRRAPADVGYYRLRAPARPIALGELATMPVTPAAQAAVVRATNPPAP